MAVLSPVTWVRFMILNPSTRTSSAVLSLKAKRRERRMSKFTIFGSRYELRGTRLKRAKPPDPFWPPAGVPTVGPEATTPALFVQGVGVALLAQAVGKLPEIDGV